MNHHPTGTVTFLFTDIEGSTQLWERHAAWMAVAHARHEAILRQAIAAHGGWAYKQIGDAFQAAFQTAPAALAAALAAQQALAAEPWGEPGELRVRMALHSGVAEERADDYVGPLLNRVARLMSAGHGGQILLTAATYELARDHLPAAVELRDLGERQLKDLLRPEPIWQVVAAGLPGDFPPLNALDNRPNNLPAAPNAFIGREAEVATVGGLLRQPSVRLLTLTGPGGVGKTRLALQVTGRLLDAYPEGVWFVDLAPLSDAALVMPTVAAVLGVLEQAGATLLETLRSALRARRLLLLLDNFEQVAGAATGVSALLSAAPGLDVLVTSRVPLRIYGEKEHAVPPLALPDRRRRPHLDELARLDAVRLFTERGRDVREDFALTDANAPVVGEICARLDGLPLAIELAAARLRLFTPEALLRRLEQRLKVLTGGARDRAVRQQTLRNTINWSYELLDPTEQQLFRRLAVFRGSRSLPAVEAVCNYDGQLAVDVFSGMASLLTSSLLQQRIGSDGEPRLSILETLHEYARDKLEQSGEAKPLRDAHLAYFTVLGEQAEGALSGPRLVAWLDRLEEEHDNFRAALDWAEVSGEVETGLRIALGVFEFWSARGHWSEGRERLARLLAQPRERVTDFSRAKALMRAAYLAYAQTDLAAAYALAQPAEGIFRRLAATPELAECLRQLGQTAFARGDFNEGYAPVQESVGLFREIIDRPGGRVGLATALRTLGWGARERGEYATARAALEESLSLARDLKHDMALMGGLRHLAVLERVTGDYASASRLLEQSLETSRRLAHVEGTAYGLLELARVRLRQGGLPAAARLAAESLALFRQLGDSWGAAVCVAVLSGVASSIGQPARAVRLMAAAVTFTEGISAPFFPEDRREHDRYLVTPRATLDAATCASVWAEGQAMSLEDAIAHALEERPDA